MHYYIHNLCRAALIGATILCLTACGGDENEIIEEPVTKDEETPTTDKEPQPKITYYVDWIDDNSELHQSVEILDADLEAGIYVCGLQRGDANIVLRFKSEAQPDNGYIFPPRSSYGWERYNLPAPEPGKEDFDTLTFNRKYSGLGTTISFNEAAFQEWYFNLPDDVKANNRIAIPVEITSDDALIAENSRDIKVIIDVTKHYIGFTQRNGTIIEVNLNSDSSEIWTSLEINTPTFLAYGGIEYKPTYTLKFHPAYRQLDDFNELLPESEKMQYLPEKTLLTDKRFYDFPDGRSITPAPQKITRLPIKLNRDEILEEYGKENINNQNLVIPIVAALSSDGITFEEKESGAPATDSALQLLNDNVIFDENSSYLFLKLVYN